MSTLQTKPVRLSVAGAGEILTLQRAAYVTETQRHDDIMMPPLTQSLDQLRSELADPHCVAWGIREAGRLVATTSQAAAVVPAA